MFTQPTPVLSLGSELRNVNLSSQPSPTGAGEQTSLSGWWVLVSTDPLCGNFSALPSPPLLLCSPPWLRSFPVVHPSFPPVKGLPSVWKLFLLHSSLPEVQVPSLFFCLCFSFFLLPYPGTWGVSCPLGTLRSSASIQYVFCRSCSTCRCIFDVFVGRKVISMSYSSIILKFLSLKWFLIHDKNHKLYIKNRKHKNIKGNSIYKSHQKLNEKLNNKQWENIGKIHNWQLKIFYISIWKVLLSQLKNVLKSWAGVRRKGNTNDLYIYGKAY